MLLGFLTALTVYLITAQNVFAVSVTISNVPSTVTDQPFNIDVSVTGAGTGTNYIRANLFPTGSSNYFGYTFNGSSFINSSVYSDYLPVNIDSSGNWNGTIQAKLDPSNFFTGPGSYSLKVRRYTPTGSTYTWSNEVTVNINYANPTPTPTPSPTLSPTTSITPTPQPDIFSFSAAPIQINSNLSFTIPVQLNLPSSPNTLFYLKGAFKKSDSSNYFGLTKVGSNWIKNSNSYSDQLQITTDSSGSWSGNLDLQPDSTDSGFTGSGQYVFKIARYSSNGSGPNWSNETTVTITQVSSPSPTSTPAPTISIKPTPAVTPKTSTELDNNQATVAGEFIEATPSTNSSTSPTNPPSEFKNEKQSNPLPFIAAGLILISSSAVYIMHLHSLQSKIWQFIKPRLPMKLKSWPLGWLKH